MGQNVSEYRRSVKKALKDNIVYHQMPRKYKRAAQESLKWGEWSKITLQALHNS
jgi:hypothetical protein